MTPLTGLSFKDAGNGHCIVSDWSVTLNQFPSIALSLGNDLAHNCALIS